MPAETVLDLFDEFARSFARGESPSVLDYVERAGEQGDELAGMLNRFLASAPAPAAARGAGRDDARLDRRAAADPRAAKAARV